MRSIIFTSLALLALPAGAVEITKGCFERITHLSQINALELTHGFFENLILWHCVCFRIVHQPGVGIRQCRFYL